MDNSHLYSGGELQLGGQFNVLLAGKDLGPPPSSAVAVLLLVLAFNNDWVPRSELESKLHPNTDPKAQSNSFRQTLFRLKKWIGSDQIRVESRRIRLNAPWLMRIANSSGELVTASRIAAGIDHPWMDELRQQFASRFGAIGSTEHSHFYNMLQGLSESDREIGRAVLTSGAHLLEAHSQAEVLNIFAALRPRRGMEVYSAEFYLERSKCAMRFGSFDSAVNYALRAFRIAQKKRQSAVSAQSAAYLMFWLLEKGEETESQEWLGTLKKMERTPLTRTLVRNAELAFYWNAGDFDQASSIMESIELSSLPSSTRSEQLHYWANASLFFAEREDAIRSGNCLLKAKELIQPKLDFTSDQMLELSQIVVQTTKRNYQQSLENIKQLVSLCESQEFHLSATYALAHQALILAKMGKVLEARKVWLEVESRRRAFGGGLPERVKRQKAALQVF
ncbi:MAG: hypothetical protein KF824_00825 [Fimbriimonadaceae bacterium]|nr:MAG: hypothetical protein KF824_00825 [Fimbriimonadaceae bacterium]